MAVENIAEVRFPSPAVSFYFNDFIAGTLAFSTAECGAYLLLLAYQWNSGSVPNDPVDRARIMRAPSTRAGEALWTRVRGKFIQGTDGQWRNNRMELERDKQARHRAAQIENGRKGGRPKTQPKPNRNPRVNSGLTQTEPKKSLSSSSSDLPDPSDPPDPRGAKGAPLHARARQTGGVMAGTLPRDHLNCHPPCIRVCISEKQHAILRERHGGTDADMEAFYAEVREHLHGPVGQRPWQFWDEQFAARFAAPAVNSRTAGNLAAVRQWLQKSGGQS